MVEDKENAQYMTKELFGKKSNEYNKSSLLTDPKNLKLILDMAKISNRDRILDVATGTGFLSIAMADTGAEVLATDFTLPMLQKAGAALEGKKNARLALADADRLPFVDESYDVVACRVAVHHFANPQMAFNEMGRVCKQGGRVIIMDVISSEDEAKSKLHNKMAKLRDPSEVRQWRRSELIDMLQLSGLTIEKVELWPHDMAFDEWIQLGGADEGTAETIKEMMMDSMDGDKADLHPKLVGDDLIFTWTTAIIIARK